MSPCNFPMSSRRAFTQKVIASAAVLDTVEHMTAGPARLTATLELRYALVGEFSRRCWQTLSEWNDGVSTRSATMKSLETELLTLADTAPAADPLVLATKLTSAYAVAAAISCRSDDLDADRSNDLVLVGESLVDLELNLDANDRVTVPARIRAAASNVGTGEDTSELAVCIAITAAAVR